MKITIDISEEELQELEMFIKIKDDSLEILCDALNLDNEIIDIDRQLIGLANNNKSKSAKELVRKRTSLLMERDEKFKEFRKLNDKDINVIELIKNHFTKVLN